MFLVIADIYKGSYGIVPTLFGIYDTEAEAVKSILDQPIRRVPSLYGDGEFQPFSFLSHYREDDNDIDGVWAYIKRCFLKEFDGTPTILAHYVE